MFLSRVSYYGWALVELWLGLGLEVWLWLGSGLGVQVLSFGVEHFVPSIALGY